jgi:hypothetical protein
MTLVSMSWRSLERPLLPGVLRAVVTRVEDEDIT